MHLAGFQLPPKAEIWFVRDSVLDMVSVYGIDNVENFRIILFCDFSLPSETDDIDIQSLVDKMYLVVQYGRVLMNLTVQVMNHGIDYFTNVR